MSETKANQQPAGNAFVNALSRLRRGETAAVASDKLIELLEAVKREAKGGTLTLTINVKPEKGSVPGEVEQVTVEPSIKVTLPQRKLRPQQYYLNEDCSLATNDPKQPEFEGLREHEEGEVREAGQPAGEQATGTEG